MSYDLMVFEPTAAPRDPETFMKWYRGQTAWTEAHSYNDPCVTSPNLSAWFAEMIGDFPPMNGPLASKDYDNAKVSDYCIGKVVIYVAFAWSEAQAAYEAMRRSAVNHSVGFYDVSGYPGEIWFPDA